MIDFRYHALSLVAVFLALAIGIVLGVTIGDSLVSDADRNLRESLRDDVTEARGQVRDEQELGARREQVIEEAAPVAASGRLRGRAIALIAFHELPGNVSEAVEESVELGHGRLVRTAILDRRPRRLGVTPARVARLITRGGAAARRLRARFPRQFSGSYVGPVDAVVVYRHPPEESSDERASEALDRRERFEDALLEGLRDTVVGVEASETDPSQVGFFEEHALASVDNIDLAAGKLSLVLLLEQAAEAALTGEPPEGSFGYKESSDRAVPDLSE